MATAPQATNATNRPPKRIFSTMIPFQQTDGLKAGIQLDIFTKIAEGANDAGSVAKAIGADQRGTRILCDYMAIAGFLTKDDDKYSLAPDSALFLNKQSPAYMGAMANFLGTRIHRENFGVLADAVRKGGCATDRGDNAEAHDDFWVPFARSMAGLATPSAEYIATVTSAAEAKPVKVLDIAAGHGMFGITIARRNPNAHVVALDWPAVLAVAEENAKKFGVADRVTSKPGSAFETDFGEGYDYILLTNILHHFDAAGCETLLRKVHKALKPGGKAITLEFVPNEDRVTPPVAAAFSIVMLANTDKGEAHTFAAYEQMTKNAGFAKSMLQQVPNMPQQLVISEK